MRKRMWKRIHTCICTTESLCFTPETHTTLWINYTPIENKNWKASMEISIEACYVLVAGVRQRVSGSEACPVEAEAAPWRLGEPPWGDERHSQVMGTRRAQKGMSERRSTWRAPVGTGAWSPPKEGSCSQGWLSWAWTLDHQISQFSRSLQSLNCELSWS